MPHFVDVAFDEANFEISNVNVNQIIHDVIMKIIIFVFEIFSQLFIFNAKKNINDFRSVSEKFFSFFLTSEMFSTIYKNVFIDVSNA